MPVIRRAALLIITVAALGGVRANVAQAEEAGLLCQAACYAAVIACCGGATEFCPECVELLDSCLALCIGAPF
jgi:hypothetical protein